jgi:hypothetical protein
MSTTLAAHIASSITGNATSSAAALRDDMSGEK